MQRPLLIVVLSALGVAAWGGASQSASTSAAGDGRAQVRQIRDAATRSTKAFVDGDAVAFCNLLSPRLKTALREAVGAGPCPEVAKLVIASGRSDFLTACEVKVARVTIRGHKAILDAPHGRGDQLVKVHGHWLIDLDSNPSHNNEIHGLAAYRKCLRPT